MRARLLTALAAAAVASLLVAAGCGGSGTVSKDEYGASVIVARDRVDFALAQITVGQGTFELLVERMKTAADRIDEAAADLEDAGAAEGFEDETSGLVEAFHQLAADLDGTASDASQPGMESLLTDALALQFPSWGRANRILADLAEQGIEVEPIGSR